jgi:hypothetical protein
MGTYEEKAEASPHACIKNQKHGITNHTGWTEKRPILDQKQVILNQKCLVLN